VSVIQTLANVVCSPAVLPEIKQFDTGAMSAAYEGGPNAVLGAGWGNVMIL